MKVRTTVCGLAVCAAALLAVAGSAAADDAGQQVTDTGQVASVVENATSPEQEAEDVTAKTAPGGGFTANGGDVLVTIPANATGAVSATTQTADGSITVKVGTGATETARGQLAPDGSVVYDSAGTTDQTVQPTTDGFRIHTVIASAAAPTAVRHDLTLPVGTHLVQESDLPVPTADATVTTNDSGAVFIVDASGSIVGGFSTPWAKDANGTDVTTHYEIQAGDLVQVIDHQQAGVVYPVVADPYLGFDLIKKAVWSASNSGWTLQVTPTAWARANAGGYLVGVKGWNELYSKYKAHGLTKNLTSMKNQFICHQVVVAVVSPTKATWNIDEWRPNVGYAATIKAKCNP